MRTLTTLVLGLSLAIAGSRAISAENQVAGTPPGQAHNPSAAPTGGHYGEQSGDLPNFHEVHPFLYRGGQPTEAGLKKLKEMGITTIIDLRGSPEMVFDERKAATALGLKCINLPMSSKAPTKEQVRTFLETVEEAQKQPDKSKVFVHCAHGSDRTGCMVGLWRVTHDGWNYDQAYKEMRRYWFTPKFTNLSGTVAEYASKTGTAVKPAGAASAAGAASR